MSETPVFKPRLCHLRKWDSYDGYGFNLQAEKMRPGHYIGKVEPGSPAEYGGLKVNDKIVEVNGTNLGNKTHNEAVVAIKEKSSEVVLLVVDSKTAEYFNSFGVDVSSQMADLEICETPPVRPNPSFATTEPTYASNGQAEAFQNISNLELSQGGPPTYSDGLHEVPMDKGSNADSHVPEALSYSAPSDNQAYQAPVYDAAPVGAPAVAPANTPAATSPDTPAATPVGTPAATPPAAPTVAPAGAPAATPAAAPAAAPTVAPAAAPNVAPAVTANANAATELSPAEIRAQLKSKGKGKSAVKEGQNYTDKLKLFENM